MKAAVLSSLLALSAQTVYAQVKGTPDGFAAGTTGGGSAAAAAPSSLEEYVQFHSFTMLYFIC